MLHSSLLHAAHSASQTIQDATLYIKTRFRKFERVEDIHRDAVTRFGQNLARPDGTKHHVARELKATSLYAKFLIKSMTVEPHRSWDWVNMLPRFFAFNADGQMLGEVICLSMEEDALHNDLRRLLALHGIASANDSQVHIGFLEGNGFQMFTTIGEAGDDFVREVRGFHALISRRPDDVE